jgi:hypothetical protein
MQAWKRYSKESGKCMQTARIRLLGVGKYAFETSLFDKPWELNINMPLFNTEEEAAAWIEQAGKWRIAEAST